MTDQSVFVPDQNVSDKDMIDERYNYQYIHNVFADFVKASLDWFGELYPRFQWKIIGTYDKSVEYINKQIELGRNPDKPNVPALILNPTGEFGLDETASGARQIGWRFPNLAPGLISRLYDPIYEDNDVRVCVGFSRLKGEFEMITLLPSFYEYFDLRILLIQQFGDIGRPIYPQWFNSFLILPSEVYLYEYNNPYTGVRHTLDWDKSQASEVLIKTTNKNEIVVPCRMRPRFELKSLTDASTKYGGTDRLADWRLSFTIEYQLEMPSMIMVLTDHLVQNIKLDVRHTLNYSPYYSQQDIISDRSLINFYWDVSVDSTSEDYFQVIKPDHADVTKREDYVLNNVYSHIVTQEQADSTSDIIIVLPEQITDNDALLILSSNGYLKYRDHYYISDDGLNLFIRKPEVVLEKDQILQLLVYSTGS